MQPLEAKAVPMEGLRVRRALPRLERRTVGPFLFLDHLGPHRMAPGGGLDVRPHPHIGLSTLTFLYEGQVVHRDSLGVVQTIQPGQVNWMTAGRGIVHSERTAPSTRQAGGVLHGLQFWVGLPRADEEVEPSFQHAAELPAWQGRGLSACLVAGRGYGHEAAVRVSSPLVLVDVSLAAGARFELGDEYPELAVYVVEGVVRVGQEVLQAGTLGVSEAPETVEALASSRLAVFGGVPFPERRYLDWNFASSDRARLDRARADWRERRFPTIPGDDAERVEYP